ncbi:hypothetical protein CYMTET_12382 [Cymbomonas tetramitiformis]|uniref:Uncharacterized protein n=1 Tax=Cymbomonas tetramitiformis TaxID=36881 RepID=A0AAE0GKL7_9CHLO|nr:hypothetical protein CYMTET_12382 [Cymbomonas tetramitiformis]
MPSLGTQANTNRLVALENSYFETAKPQEITGGKGVTVSLIIALQESMRTNPAPADNTEVKLQSGDGATLFRGITQTTIPYNRIVKRAEDTHPQISCSVNSSLSNESLAVFTGKEEYVTKSRLS